MKQFSSLILALIFYVSLNNISAQTVKIGTQVWLLKNLDVTTFRNGDYIPQAKTIEELENANNNNQPAWCYYNNDPANGPKYGKFYNWYAVNDPRGLAPKGWHVPSIYEWLTLQDYLGEDDAATKMKTNFDWELADEELGGVNGNNESGFSALPAGRYSNGEFYELNFSTFYWTNSESYPTVWLYYLFSNLQIYEDTDGNEFSNVQSVRCIKD
jgi:uncharacterized protein (TIGR02145 family)